MSNLVEQSEINNYLSDYKNGRIKQGLGIGCALDDVLRYKQGTFNMYLGHDNSGKTYFKMWHYLVLAEKHNKKFGIWTGENKAGQIVRNLIQIREGRYIKDMTEVEITRYATEISENFKFVSNKRSYKPNEILQEFGELDIHCGLIDPFTGLDRGFSHADNYLFLNETREWVNRYNVTIDVCLHPYSAAGRMSSVYPKDHAWEGYIKIPSKSDAEGGKPFANRCDDFIIIHRFPSHPELKYKTMVTVEKIKDTETGGQQTEYETPVMLDFNKGLGFKIDEINPLTDKEVKPVENYVQKKLEPNKHFADTENEISKDVPF